MSVAVDAIESLIAAHATEANRLAAQNPQTFEALGFATGNGMKIATLREARGAVIRAESHALESDRARMRRADSEPT